MTLAPIVLFVYNRPWHTKKTVEALQKNGLADESELYIYSDAAKNESTIEQVAEVRKYIKSIKGFQKITIIEREKNWGLANSIIDGVSNIVNQYGKIIVLEDDLVTSPYFLKFMNEALKLYKSNERIFVISGYSPVVKIPQNYQHDIYLTHRSSSWGWATWNKEWNSVKWENEFYKDYSENKRIMQDFSKKGGTDRPVMLQQQMHGKINSWAIRRGFTQFLQNKYAIYPVKSLVKNIGHDGSGVHCRYDKLLMRKDMLPNKTSNISLPLNLEENLDISRLINKYHTKTLMMRIYKKLLRLFGND